MDTIPFHWDTLDAPQCLRMACLCPDECHEGWLCSKLLCFTYLLATGSAAYHFSQRRSQHRRRNKCPPEAKGQALRGSSLKALLALDFCLFMRGHSWKSLIRCISAELLVYSIQAGISAWYFVQTWQSICHYGYVKKYTGFPPDPLGSSILAMGVSCLFGFCLHRQAGNPSAHGLSTAGHHKCPSVECQQGTIFLSLS